MAEIKIGGYLCERCGHKWVARGKQQPLVCSKCKSPYWNKPRKKISSKNKTGRR